MKPFCKLQLNEKMLLKENKLDPEEIHLIDKYGGKLPSNLKLNCCLECEKEFVTIKETNNIFCSSKCADSYNKRRMGLM